MHIFDSPVINVTIPDTYDHYLETVARVAHPNRQTGTRIYPSIFFERSQPAKSVFVAATSSVAYILDFFSGTMKSSDRKLTGIALVNHFAEHYPAASERIHEFCVANADFVDRDGLSILMVRNPGKPEIERNIHKSPATMIEAIRRGYDISQASMMRMVERYPYITGFLLQEGYTVPAQVSDRARELRSMA